MTSILAYVCSRYLALDPAYIPTIYVTIYLNFQSWVAHIFWHILWHAIWPFTILYKWDILSAICQRLIFWQTFRHIIWQWYFDISDIYLGFWMTDVSHMYGIYSDTSSDIRCDILSDILFWHFISHSVRALRGPKSLRARENLWVRQGPETLRPSPGREKSEITSHRPPSCHIMVVKFSIFLLVKVSNLNFLLATSNKIQHLYWLSSHSHLPETHGVASSVAPRIWRRVTPVVMQWAPQCPGSAGWRGSKHMHLPSKNSLCLLPACFPPLAANSCETSDFKQWNTEMFLWGFLCTINTGVGPFSTAGNVVTWALTSLTVLWQQTNQVGNGGQNPVVWNPGIFV